MAQKLYKIHRQILEILQKEPNGLTIHEIRERLPDDIGAQAELNKRVRELRYQYDVPEESDKYYYRGERAVQLDNQGVSSKLRAVVLNMAHGRCQMCGRTVAEDGVRLQADHKVPHNWGGPTTLENLWAICELCNSGKRDFFKSFGDEEMKTLVAIESVHGRIATLLKLRKGSEVPAWFLEFVANVNDFQDDWPRRTRELRSLGIDYKVVKRRAESGKVEAFYRLTKWKSLPADPSAEVRRIEQAKRK